MQEVEDGLRRGQAQGSGCQPDHSSQAAAGTHMHSRARPVMKELWETVSWYRASEEVRKRALHSPKHVCDFGTLKSERRSSDPQEAILEMLTILLMSGDQHVLLTGYGLLGSFPPLKPDLTDPELFSLPPRAFSF